VHEPVPDDLEGVEILGAQADVVDATASEHRHLPPGLRVADDLEDVEHRAVSDVDQGQPHPRALRGLPHVRGDGRLEHLAVEGVEPVGVAREGRDVVDPVEEHGVLVSWPWLGEVLRAGRARLPP